MNPPVLIYDPVRQVVFCVVCLTGVSGLRKHLDYHLRHHHGDIVEATRTLIAMRLAAQGGICSKDTLRRQQAERHGYSEFLKTYPDGLACSFDGCSHCFRSAGSAANHWRQHHAGHPGSPRPVTVSTIFPRPDEFYFAVTCPPMSPHPDIQAVDTDPLAPLNQAYQAYLQRRHQRLAVIPADLPYVERDSWDKRTRWSVFFAGRDMTKLSQLLSFPTINDPESWTQTLLPAISRTVTKWHDGASTNQNTRVLQYFRSVDPVLNPKPLQVVRKDSLSSYTNFWQHFILFLLRASPSPDEVPLTLDPDMEQLTDSIRGRLLLRGKRARDCSHSPSLTRGPLGTVDEEHELCHEIEALSRCVLKQCIPNAPTKSPLMVYLGVLGWNPDRMAWRHPTDYRPTLSRAVYVLRIIGLEDALPAHKREEMQCIPTARAYTTQYLHNESEAVFAEIQSLRVYAKGLAQDYRAKPNVVWSPDNTVLRFEGHPVEMAKVRGLVHGVVERSRQILLDHLVFQGTEPTPYLDSRHPKRFTDRMTWSTNGDSFCTFTENKLGNGHVRVLGWANEHADGQKYRDYLLGPSAGRGRASYEYGIHVEKFRQLLCLAIHLSGGMPARGTELTSLKHTNAATSMRNVYLLEGRAVVITEYNKTQAVTDRAKVIARFLPASVATLYVAFVADVLPFHNYLWVSGGGADVEAEAEAESPYIWSHNGVPWTTDKVSNIMKTECTEAFGFPCTVAPWRQIAVAIDKRLLRERYRGSEEEIAAVNHAWQAGHTEEVENQYYALSADMLRGTSMATLEVFSHVSLLWHELFGLTEPQTGPTPASRKRRRQDSPTGSDNPRHGHDPRLQAMQDGIAHLVEMGRETSRLLTHLAKNRITAAPNATSTTTVTDAAPNATSTTTVTDAAPTTAVTDATSTIAVTDAAPTTAVTDAASGTAVESIPDDPPLASGAPSCSFNSVDIPPPEGVVDDALRTLYGPEATYRSPEQRDAAHALLQPHGHIVVRLPTGAGKSLLIMLSAYMQRSLVTLVVIPYIALRADLRRKAAQLGLQSLVYTADTVEHSTLVFVVPELVVTKSFASYRDRLVTEQLLCRVFFDECHTLTSSGSWREAMAGVPACFTREDVPVTKIYLSATLPATQQRRLELLMGIRPRDLCCISAPTTRPNISYRVRRAPRVAHHGILQGYVRRQRAKGERTTIMCMSRNEALELGRLFNVEVHISGYDRQKQNVRLIEDFQTGVTDLLIGTCGIGVGLDTRQLTLAITWRNTFDLVTADQFAGRAGRMGEPSLAVFLLDSSSAGAIGKAGDTGEDVEALRRLLTTNGCRREILSNYFDRVFKVRCEGDDLPCDNCLQQYADHFPDDWVPASEAESPSLTGIFQHTMADTFSELIPTSGSVPSVRPSPGSPWVVPSPHPRSSVLAPRAPGDILVPNTSPVGQRAWTTSSENPSRNPSFYGSDIDHVSSTPGASGPLATHSTPARVGSVRPVGPRLPSDDPRAPIRGSLPRPLPSNPSGIEGIMTAVTAALATKTSGVDGLAFLTEAVTRARRIRTSRRCFWCWISCSERADHQHCWSDCPGLGIEALDWQDHAWSPDTLIIMTRTMRRAIREVSGAVNIKVHGSCFLPKDTHDGHNRWTSGEPVTERHRSRLCDGFRSNPYIVE